MTRCQNDTCTTGHRHNFSAPERIQFKLAISSTELLTAGRLLSDLPRHVADMPSRSRLRPSSTSRLDVRPSYRVTDGDRLFAAAGPTVHGDITSAPSLSGECNSTVLCCTVYWRDTVWSHNGGRRRAD